MEMIEEIMRPYQKLLLVTGSGGSGWLQYLSLPVKGPYTDEQMNEALMPLMAIDELFRRPQVTGTVLQEGPDFDGHVSVSLMMRLRLTHDLPRSLNVLRNGIFLHAAGKDGILKVPVYDGSLRYYYPDYENYWYFPAEDMAIHKNLAQYADQTHRQKATAETAYTRICADAASGWSRAQQEDYCRSILGHLLL